VNHARRDLCGGCAEMRIPTAIGVTEGSKATLGNPFIGVPGVIAGEIEVFPAKRGDMLEQGGIELPYFAICSVARSM